MTFEEFAELVDWIDVRYGKIESWVGAHDFRDDFTDVESDDVWGALLAYTDNPDHSYPPRPRQLRALALDRMRERQRHERPPALPETTETWNWAEYCQREYGEVLSMGEAIRRRAAELEEAHSG